jgi:hypothetical protein
MSDLPRGHYRKRLADLLQEIDDANDGMLAVWAALATALTIDDLDLECPLKNPYYTGAMSNAIRSLNSFIEIKTSEAKNIAACL